MNLSKNTVIALIALMVIALCGLVFLQYKLLMNTIELKEQTHRRNVYAAMNVAAERLEEIDARNRMFVADSNATRPFQIRVLKHGNDAPSRRKDSTVSVTVMTTNSPGMSTKLENGRLWYSIGKPQRVTVKLMDALGRVDTILADVERNEGSHEIALPRERLKQGTFFVQIKTDSGTSTYRWNAGGETSVVTYDMMDRSRDKLIRRVFESVAPTGSIPLAKRVDSAVVDSLLSIGLANNDVALPFEYAVADLKKASIVKSRSTIQSFELFPKDYAVPLFQHEFGGTPAALYMRFPTYRSHLVGELLPELGSSLVLILVIIFCFWYTVRTILRQREFSGRMSDFINNMTHEFKTPISTIGLASEAIVRPDVITSRKKILRYKNVIADENVRMKDQVERILQMASLEDGEVEFSLKPINVHTVINKAVKNIALQASARHGEVKMDLKAEHAVIQGDIVHIENVIHNVLDNAAKYSPAAPSIVVETMNMDGWLVVSVKDKGIGIAKEHASRIFDKYYRVPTGNVHDVKGFGLGLSYVRLVVEAHGGSVGVESELGKGTTVELRLPR